VKYPKHLTHITSHYDLYIYIHPSTSSALILDIGNSTISCSPTIVQHNTTWHNMASINTQLLYLYLSG
jgi:hypothetical protein